MSEIQYLKGTLEFLEKHYDSWPSAEMDPRNAAQYDPDKPIDVQTDKETGKLVPCTECGRAIYVNAFYAPAIAKCSDCKPTATGSGGGNGSQAVVQAGKTDPARAANLASCLVNEHFAIAMCPVHPDDPEHEMELKSVDHHQHYGPSELIGYDAKGRPNYRQTGIGETVMHQCLKCKATVSYSTTAQQQFRCINEPTKDRKHTNAWGSLLGTRDEEEPNAA